MLFEEARVLKYKTRRKKLVSGSSQDNLDHLEDIYELDGQIRAFREATVAKRFFLG